MNRVLYKIFSCFTKQCFIFEYSQRYERFSWIFLFLFTLLFVFVNNCAGNFGRHDEKDYHISVLKFHDSITKEIENNMVIQTTVNDDLPHKAFLHHWFYVPRIEATIESINDTLFTMFSKPRSSEFNQSEKQLVRTNVTHKLANYGLQVLTQEFVVRSIREKPLNGENIIAILAGKFRGTPSDVVTVIGAHYDTVEECPGVDDNGSGATAIMEIARVLSSRRNEFNDTIIFVLFDLEEWGALGSLAFVDHYLIPKELIAKNVQFRGAFIADMILNYDDKPHTQDIPTDIKTLLPEVNSEVESNGNRGDFLTIWMRKQVDDDLLTFLTNSWRNEHKIVAMRPPIPATNVTYSEIQKFRTFLRSDHASFWIHKNDNYKLPLKAILLTDMGPWRGEQRVCYHDRCDDSRHLTHNNLAFLKNTIDALIEMVVNHF